MELKQVGEDLYGVFELSRSHRLISSVVQGLHQDIGKIEKFEKKINLNGDKKRLWDADLKSLKDDKMNVSAPLAFPYYYSKPRN